MQTLSIDIETFSSVDIKKCGAHKYVESPDFEILLISFRYEDWPIRTIDLTRPEYRGAKSLSEFCADLQDPDILKTAWNASFEILCLSKYFGVKLDPSQWSCTMSKAAMLGLPLSLDQCAQVLDLPVQKDAKGKALIKYFSCPCKPTKANGERVRNYPHHAPEKWQQYIEYNKTDVQVETAIADKIKFFEVPHFEAPMYKIDLSINSRGVKIDRALVENAIKINKVYTARLHAEAVALTGLNNPNSVAQLKDWLEAATLDEIDSLKKDAIPELIKTADSDKVKRVLEIRQLTSKSSVKKYQAMLNMACSDDRIRGLFQYYGANRTGRWAGRGVQVQNLVKNYMAGLDVARDLVRGSNLEILELIFGDVNKVLSQLLRTAFIPEPGNKLIVTDFSAIEARVIAWLAGEQWRLDVFNTHGKIYEASGSRIFKMPIDDIKKGSVERDASKVAELALGYQGGKNALQSMIDAESHKARERGKKWTYWPTDDEKQELVNQWRAASPNIVKLWYQCNDAAIEAVANPGARVKAARGLVTYFVKKGVLFCELPSGRSLAYMRPRLVPNKFGGVQVQYEGMNQTTKRWERMRAYGGLLVENITQAVARDLLAEKMKLLDAFIVMHVHDEIVLEGSDVHGDAAAVDRVMSAPVSWALGLPLKGDGFETYYYRKED